MKDWKKPLPEIPFWSFRKSQSFCFNQNFICLCRIYNSCKSFQLDYSNKGQLVEIYLFLNNFTKFFSEEITVITIFPAYIALLAYWTLLTQIYHTQYFFLTASIVPPVFLSTLSSIMQWNFSKFFTDLRTRKCGTGCTPLPSYFCESSEITASIVVLLLLQQCINLKLEDLLRKSATRAGMKETLSV